jgi:hypothetical protein
LPGVACLNVDWALAIATTFRLALSITNFSRFDLFLQVWNMQTSAEMNLTGPAGQVYALAVANELLFAATQVNFPSFGHIFWFVLVLLIFSFNYYLSCFVGWEDFGLEI